MLLQQRLLQRAPRSRALATSSSSGSGGHQRQQMRFLQGRAAAAAAPSAALASRRRSGSGSVHSAAAAISSSIGSTTLTSRPQRASGVRARSSPENRQQQQSQPPALGSLDALEIAVPSEQRPVNELAQLKGALLYSWACLPQAEYVKRLAGLFGFFFLLVGCPISYVTFDPLADPAEFALSAAVGSLAVVVIACLRIWGGWRYVGERLQSATVAYEETGWYDGQRFVKPPEVLARDRLLAAYEVRPTLARLRGAMVGAAALLVAGSLVLGGLIRAHSDEDGVYGRGSMRTPRQVTAAGLVYSKSVDDISQLASDDALAEAEAQELLKAGVPGYCADRMLKAAAGGLGCPKVF